MTNSTKNNATGKGGVSEQAGKPNQTKPSGQTTRQQDDTTAMTGNTAFARHRPLRVLIFREITSPQDRFDLDVRHLVAGTPKCMEFSLSESSLFGSESPPTKEPRVYYAFALFRDSYSLNCTFGCSFKSIVIKQSIDILIAEKEAVQP